MKSYIMNKTWSRLLCAGLAVAAMVLVMLMLGGCGADNASTQTVQANTEAQSEEKASEESNQQSEDGKKQEEGTESTQSSGSNQDNSLYDVVFTAQTTWGEEGNYGGTYNIAFTNHAAEEVSEWSFEAEVPADSEVSQAWGCEVVIDGTHAVITAADWGAAVAAGQKIEVGFNMNTPKLFTPQVQALNVNGSDAAGAVASASSDDSNPKTEEGTTEQVEPAVKPEPEDGTPVENHGRLSVKGTQLVDKDGNPYQLKGVSTHGLAWFPDYVNKDAFQTIRDDWGGNVVRLAMYSDENGGYCSGGDQAKLKGLVESGVSYATELGMYVIIDWHVLGDADPLRHKDEAKKFFTEMSAKYADFDNVIYEICNEPNNGATWSGNIRPYAEEIIPVIRANDKDAVIIVGTPTWSQDVDVVADDYTANPIPDAGNVMFAVHFYAATHKDYLRDKVTYALGKGLPIFVSEFSICDASGNGANDYNEAEKWFNLMNDKTLSYCAWSLCNKAETSALISSGCNKTSGWSEGDLSETGKWIRKQIQGGI